MFFFLTFKSLFKTNFIDQLTTIYQRVIQNCFFFYYTPQSKLDMFIFIYLWLCLNVTVVPQYLLGNLYEEKVLYNQANALLKTSLRWNHLMKRHFATLAWQFIDVSSISWLHVMLFQFKTSGKCMLFNSAGKKLDLIQTRAQNSSVG